MRRGRDDNMKKKTNPLAEQKKKELIEFVERNRSFFEKLAKSLEKKRK